MNKFLLSAFTSVVIASTAHANVVSQDINVVTGTTPVHYLNFDVVTGGIFNLDAFGDSTLGVGFDNDTYLHLFKTSLTLENYLGGDNDSGNEYDAHLTMSLGVGNYILAVGDYSFSVADAINGIGGYVEAPGGIIRAQVSSTNGVAVLPNSVSEPESLAPIWVGIIGTCCFTSPHRHGANSVNTFLFHKGLTGAVNTSFQREKPRKQCSLKHAAFEPRFGF